ncbi:MAG TPA: response regulator transcription factor [Clostridia bacterium]|nr:response regulator transcription factor [Clostridia bacterium]HPZ51666.1 response regulator transcription factor [Clostridia bacterium]
MIKVLICDDNRQITSILEEYCKREGYKVKVAYDGEEALEFFSSCMPDIILLDVMMPKLDGFYVCKEIRKKSNVPVIMVTARGEDFEKIMGLEIGADDYIVKPFSGGEVMARIRAILRRCSYEGRTEGHELKIANLYINMDSYEVMIDDEEVSLTKKETEILWLLASNSGKVFSRENLLDKLWGYDYYGDMRTVDSHIKRLRAKIDAFPHESWDVTTIWGVGYRFTEYKEGKG